METILQTTNLSRQFGKKMAVNNVNMTIHKGDIYLSLIHIYETKRPISIS